MKEATEVSRRSFLHVSAGMAIGLGVAASTSVVASGPVSWKRHFVLVHGAWHGAWAWKDVAPILWRAGHRVSVPTLAGLGERQHRNSPEIGLYTHSEDVAKMMFMDDARDVILVGHSYAGCVIADLLGQDASRVAHAVFLDAFVPGKGKGLADFVPPQVRETFVKLDAKHEPIGPPPAQTWEERWGLVGAHLEYARARLSPQSVRCFLQPVRENPFHDSVRYTYLKAKQNPNPGFVKFGEMARQNPRFDYREIDGHHDVMVIDPQRTAEALLALV
jgi:pimeloyl-ACP methyl ester carboxylesterase